MSSAANLKKYNLLIAFCLLVCAFIYIFYRVEGSAVNIILRFFAPDSMVEFKASVREVLPLNEAIIYSLPGGLWVFCATLLSKNLRLTVLKRQLNLEWFPVLFALWLEFWQFFEVINGRFDWVDILLVILFALLARVLTSNFQYPKQNIFAPFNIRSFVFASVFLSVFMAHVF